MEDDCMKANVHVNTELLIDIIQGCLEEEGHETKRYSDSKKYETSEYDCIAIKGNDGNYYELTVSECKDRRNPYTGEIKKARDHYNDI